MQFIDNLKNGKPQLGVVVSFHLPAILESIAKDWDWLWLDNQHGHFNFDTLSAAIINCGAVGEPCIVRTSCLNDGEILKALDAGADGVMIPMIETSKQAEAAAKAAKFPPAGRRSFGSNLLLAREGREHYERANENTLLVCQIETKLGMENLDGIAAVEGVDALLFGFFDLALSMGMQPDQAGAAEFIAGVLEQASPIIHKHGKILGGFVTSPEAIAPARDLGCRMIGVDTDIGMLKRQSIDTANIFRKAVAGR